MVDGNGTRRLAITNRDRLPNVVMDGKEATRDNRIVRPAGIVVYDEHGDEAGGLATTDTADGAHQSIATSCATPTPSGSSSTRRSRSPTATFTCSRSASPAHEVGQGRAPDPRAPARPRRADRARLRRDRADRPRGQAALSVGRSSLAELERGLPPAQFFRVNRTEIVSLAAIDHVESRADRVHVAMKPLGRACVVSVHRAAAFRAWFGLS